MVMGIRKLVTVGVGTDWEEVEGIFGDARNILYLNFGDYYKTVYIFQNSLNAIL